MHKLTMLTRNLVVFLSVMGIASPVHAQSGGAKALNFDALLEPVRDSITGFAGFAVAVVTALIGIGAIFYAGQLIFSGRWDGAVIARLGVAAIICLLVSAGSFSAIYG